MRTDVSKSAANLGTGVVMKHGIIMSDRNETDPTLYRVNIGDMTASATGRVETGIWCVNSIFPYTRHVNMSNNPMTYGAHMPLHPDTPVVVLIPNGGSGNGTIIAFAPTNTSVPDPENRDDLYTVLETPGGSLIAVDEKADNIQIMHKNGNSSIVLADNVINLEIGDPAKGGQEHGTSLSLSMDSFIIKLKDSTMKFDKSGLSVNFDANEEKQDKASSFLVSRDNITLAAGKNMQLNAKDSVSSKSQKLYLEGIDDASVTSNQVRINGSQLTTITGTQIFLHGFWNVQLKGMHVGLQAIMKQTETAMIKQTTNTNQVSTTALLSASYATQHVITTPAFYLSALANLQDIKVTNGGTLGIKLYGDLYASAEAEHLTLQTTGIELLTKTLATSAMTYIMGASEMAGSGQRSDNESKPLLHTKDVNDKKSLNSVAATAHNLKKKTMERISVIDPLLQASMTAVYTGGTSASSLTSGVSNMVLEAGLSGHTEAGTQSKCSNSVGLDITGITMTDSAEILAPEGTMATVRKNIVACLGYAGTDQAKMCGTSDSYNKHAGAAGSMGGHTPSMCGNHS